jgi:hypothetical protein
MGKKGVKARASGQAYHSNVATASPVYHTQANCLGGSRIGEKQVKPGRGDGRTLCPMCARLSGA